MTRTRRTVARDGAICGDNKAIGPRPNCDPYYGAWLDPTDDECRRSRPIRAAFGSFLAEKGVTVPLEQLDLFQGTNRSPEALKRNPYGGLPVLELDDGTCIAESVAICRYFEGMHPEPRLMGADTIGRAIVDVESAHGIRTVPPHW